MTKTESGERANTPFVVRNIVKKKKDPQQKLHRYFPVTKAKGVKIEKNFQGFPLTQCRYEEEIGKFVYCPPCYRSGEMMVEEKQGLCHDCLLRPCIAKYKREEIISFCEYTMVFENDDCHLNHCSKILEHAESIIVEVFGERFARNNVLPRCIYEVVCRYHDVVAGVEEDGAEMGDQPDDDLVAGAVDGDEYLP